MRRDRQEQPSSAKTTATTDDDTKKQQNEQQPKHWENADARPTVYRGTPEERHARVYNFLKSLKFSVPMKTLRDNGGRTKCPKCNKNKRWYCYDCVVGCNPICNPPKAPILPATVHVILHPGETRGKATTLPAATIAPDQLKIHTFPDIPDLKVEETALLYPSPTAVDISELSPQELSSLKNVVFIDSTWQQSKKIERDERIQSFRHIKIPAQESLFWRFQNYDPTYLATIEAIYYTLREIIQAKNKQENKEVLYNGEVDDLLLYYVYQYLTIQIEYGTEQKVKEEKEKAEADEEKKAKPENDASSKTAGASAQKKKNENDDDADQGEGEESKDNDKDNEKRGFTTRHFKGYILEGNKFEDFFQ